VVLEKGSLGFGVRQVSFVMLTTWQSALPVHLSHFQPFSTVAVSFVLCLFIFSVLFLRFALHFLLLV